MKVLHVSGARSWGGNEQQLFDMIPELERLGVENSVFCVRESPVSAMSEKLSIPCYSSNSGKLNTFSNFFFLKGIIKEVKPDVIHLHTSDSLTLFTLADGLMGLKVPAVFSKKGMGSSSSFLSRLKYNYKNVSKIICVSEAVRTSFSKIISEKNKEKLVVVYDGINNERVEQSSLADAREKFQIPEDCHLIGNIANHVKAKDLPTLVRAIHHLVHVLGKSDIRLLQIGGHTSKHTPEIEMLIKQLEVEKYIVMGGFQPRAHDYLSQFDLYVMSSEREGLPLTIYEAFSKNIPVVSTKAGGIPEAVTHNFNGFLADVRDYKALAEWMKVLLESRDKRKEFAAESYSLFREKFTSARCAAATKNLYHEVCL